MWLTDGRKTAIVQVNGHLRGATEKLKIWKRELQPKYLYKFEKSRGYEKHESLK